MYNSTFFGLNVILGSMIICGFITNTFGSKYHGDNYSTDEKILYRFFRYKNQLNWMWSVSAFCRVMCPRRQALDNDPKWTRIRTEEIVLEGADCAKMEVEILSCSCKTRHPKRVSVAGREYFVNSPNGEIYKLIHASGVCENRETGNIYDRIVGGESVKSLTQVQKLRGIGKIFSALNVRRAGWRQYNKDRVAGRLVDSDEEY